MPKSSSLLLACACLVAACTTGTATPSSPAPSAAIPSATPAMPQPRSIDIGERSMYLECRGSGSPTVVLEAGLTGDHRTWDQVAPFVGRRTRACVYDRANIEPSDPAPLPRTAADVVEDLHALLIAADEESPFVLVGFSWGGLTTQLYAATHPKEIAGLVLVESNHADENDDLFELLTPAQVAEERRWQAENPEGIDLDASFEEVQAAAALPEVPLVVVTSGVSEGWPEEWGDAAQFDAMRAAHQQDLATRIPGGVQLIAERSSHHVPSQQPEVIVEAIEQVLDRIP